MGIRNCSKGTMRGPVDNQPGSTLFVRSDCKKLSCQRCGPKRASRYRKAIGRRAEEMRLTRLMTLTLDPRRCDAEDSIAYLRKCFSKFRVSLLRRFGKTVSFIAVVELQKSGMAHLHVLIGVFIDQAWISEAWQAVGGGRIVDIRMVDVHCINAYLSKYLTKDLLLSVPARKKRVSTSRDIRLFDKTKHEGWAWTPEMINLLFFRLREQGEQIQGESTTTWGFFHSKSCLILDRPGHKRSPASKMPRWSMSHEAGDLRVAPTIPDEAGDLRVAPTNPGIHALD